MREIKQIFHTEAERDAGLQLLQAYQQESNRLLNEYCNWHKIFYKQCQEQKKSWEQYMEERKPIWEKYLSDDAALYKEYCNSAREMGWDVGTE